MTSASWNLCFDPPPLNVSTALPCQRTGQPTIEQCCSTWQYNDRPWATGLALGWPRSLRRPTRHHTCGLDAQTRHVVWPVVSVAWTLRHAHWMPQGHGRASHHLSDTTSKMHIGVACICRSWAGEAGRERGHGRRVRVGGGDCGHGRDREAGYDHSTPRRSTSNDQAPP